MSLDQTIEVPLCDIQASYRQLRGPIDAAMSHVLTTGQVILGPEVAALEREVASYCGAAHAVGCSSGSDALLLALAALDIGPGDEVILPTFTFFATAGAVARTGATPVFADIDPDTFNPAYQSDHPGSPIRPMRRHGRPAADRRSPRHPLDRRCGPGVWVRLSRGQDRGFG